MKIIFCSDPLNSTKVDPDFQKEHDSAIKAGFEVLLVDFDLLKNPETAHTALAKIKPLGSLEKVIYRGYMLTPEAYFIFHAQLFYKNFFLITERVWYEFCQYIDRYYSSIERYTPRTIWINKNQLCSLREVKVFLGHFHNTPVVIRDYLKSQKHYWDEACFIPDPSNTNHALKVIDRFIELQGEYFEGGIVMRDYVSLAKFENAEPIRKGQFPTKEYRLFYVKGKLIGKYEYWDLKKYGEEKLPLEKFNSIAKKIGAPFFSMDVAKTESGEWIIIELGDGQVSGLPDNANTDIFYKNLKENLN